MIQIKLKPIGFVKNNVKEHRFGDFANEISEIIVNKEFTKALDGIDDYSLIKHQPQGNPNVPVVGIFACRCPKRPNPIGITTVRLLEHKKNRIIIKGLDVLNGTPVIDVKPYWSQYDKVSNTKIPAWVNKLKF